MMVGSSGSAGQKIPDRALSTCRCRNREYSEPRARILQAGSSIEWKTPTNFTSAVVRSFGWEESSGSKRKSNLVPNVIPEAEPAWISHRPSSKTRG